MILALEMKCCIIYDPQILEVSLENSKFTLKCYAIFLNSFMKLDGTGQSRNKGSKGCLLIHMPVKIGV